MMSNKKEKDSIIDSLLGNFDIYIIIFITIISEDIPGQIPVSPFISFPHELSGEEIKVFLPYGTIKLESKFTSNKSLATSLFNNNFEVSAMVLSPLFFQSEWSLHLLL